MKVHVELVKQMKDAVQVQGNLQLKLHGNRLKDVFEALDNEIGEILPNSIWNRAKKRFRGPVLIIADGKILRDEDTIIKDGQLLKIKRFLVGG
jgi:hypothetical protein